MIPDLPLDIYGVIADFLAGSFAFGTLANLNVASHFIREETLPVLYETLLMNDEEKWPQSKEEIGLKPMPSVSSLAYSKAYTKYVDIGELHRCNLTAAQAQILHSDLRLPGLPSARTRLKPSERSVYDHRQSTRPRRWSAVYFTAVQARQNTYNSERGLTQEETRACSSLRRRATFYQLEVLIPQRQGTCFVPAKNGLVGSWAN